MNGRGDSALQAVLARPALERRLVPALRLVLDLLRTVERSAGPILDLVIRFALAQTFFISGLLKLGNWEVALQLAREEYPVTWLDPVTAAYTGVGIELLCPILLLFGLATRVAALPMLILALVIQFNYRALDTHLLWAALLGWYVVRGAGALSLDALLSRGLRRSALPLAGAVLKVTEAMTRWLSDPYLLLLRLWLAAGLALPLLASSGAGNWLPFASFATLPVGAAVPLAVLLTLGLASRAAAVVLMVLVAGSAMMGGVTLPAPGWLTLLLALLAIVGPGALSLDAALVRLLQGSFPELAGRPAFDLAGLPRVVIVGAGFGGLACAAALRRVRASVTLIDRHNYHLFQPLLYQVATTALSPIDIALPIRGLFREHFNTRVLLGEVSGVDTARREVILGEQRIPYDYLVLATGASHSYFGRDEWAAHAPGLKQVEDATEVRRRLLLAFERAEAAEDEEERRALLTFLIVGGGPTGVELAGAIAELARFGMERDFRRIDPTAARIILVQAGPRLLPALPEALSHKATVALQRLGVEVLTDSRVESIDGQGVRVNGQAIPARTVLWAAGVVASPAARWLGAEADKAGRLKVTPNLSVPGRPDVFAIGDTAYAEAWQGQAVPGLAPAAKQGGVYVARVIRARIEGCDAPPPFTYRHLGSLATIGRKAAVADFGWVRLSGAPAWWLWGVVHIAFLAGLRNRVSILFDWIWSYLTFRSGARLITGESATSNTPTAETLSERRQYHG
ncbi:MAG: FAD-dependent oxidoreductase [Pseudomonadota bacterium]